MPLFSQVRGWGGALLSTEVHSAGIIIIEMGLIQTCKHTYQSSRLTCNVASAISISISVFLVAILFFVFTFFITVVISSDQKSLLTTINVTHCSKYWSLAAWWIRPVDEPMKIETMFEPSPFVIDGLRR